MMTYISCSLSILSFLFFFSLFVFLRIPNKLTFLCGFGANFSRPLMELDLLLIGETRDDDEDGMSFSSPASSSSLLAGEGIGGRPVNLFLFLAKVFCFDVSLNCPFFLSFSNSLRASCVVVGVHLFLFLFSLLLTWTCKSRPATADRRMS